MTILQRPQLVLKNLGFLPHTTKQVKKTSTLSYGTLLKGDLTEATASDLELNTFDVPYAVDDYKVYDRSVKNDDYLTLRVTHHPLFLEQNYKLLKLGNTPLTEEQISLYKEGVFGQTHGPVPPARVPTHVLNMSGADLIALPNEVLIPTGQPVSGFFRVLDDSVPRVLWSGATVPRAYAYVSAGVITCPEAVSIKVDGFATSLFPNDGDMHNVEIMFGQDVYLDRFGISHTGIFSLTGQLRDVEYLGESFPVDDNAQTITGSLGTVLTLTGGTWGEYEVQDV